MEDAEQSVGAMGRREHKKVLTRRSIRSVALDLAVDVGLSHLTVEMIAEAAEISPRTFFNYFSCKEDALVTDAGAVAELLRTLVEARPAEEAPLRAIRMAMTENDPASLVQASRTRARTRQQLVQEHPALMARQLGKYAQLEQSFAAAVARRLDADVDQDLQPALIAGAAVSAIRIAVRRWTTDETASLDELIGSAFDLLEQGGTTAADAHHR